MSSKVLKLNNFGKSGLNTDLPEWDLNEQSLTFINNVRITNESLIPFGGYSSILDLPVDFQPGYIFHVASTSSGFWLIAGRDAVYIYDGAIVTDISSIGGYAGVTDEDVWTGCSLAQIPVITNIAHYPEYWPQLSTGVALERLPWDATNTWEDVNQACGIIRSHKQYLFAMQIVSGGVELPSAVRWSSPADIGGIPDSWDELDITNVAGITSLDSSGGKIIDGLSLRDAFVVYRESSIAIFDFVGGQFVWQVRELSTNVGLSSPECIVEVNGIHYFIGNGDIMVNDGNTVSSLLHNKLRNRFITSYDPDNYLNSYVLHNNIKSEIWFCVPETNNVYPNVAYVHNYRDDSWSVRDIPNPVSSSYGARQSAAINWGTVTTTWNNAQNVWAEGATSPLANTIMSVVKPAGAGQSGEILLLDLKEDPSVIDYTSTIERLGVPLEGMENVTTIQRVYPHMRGSGMVNIEVGAQEYPGGPVTWKPPVVFRPDLERKVDIRSTGELHCFRISSVNSDGQWVFSGMDVEYTLAGRR